MNDNTEELKRDMYYDIACLKGQKKHPILLARFESKLEEYLEAMRQDHAKLVDSLQIQVTLYQDAYENQKSLTRNACVYDRERWDELYQLRSDLKSAERDREEGHDKLQEATSKLARGSESIRALLRVIKAQQNACARLQAQLKVSEEAHKLTCKNLNDKLEDGLDVLDETLARCEAKQEIIVSQRKTIETLTFELVQARKETIKSSFWQFLTRKSTQAKPLPKKTI